MGQRRAARIRGREEGGAGAERESGVSGREARGGGGAGDLIPSGVGAGEGVGRQRAPVPTRSGEQGRGEGGGGLGRGRGGAAQFGPGGFGADGPRVQWGGKACSPFFSFL